MQLHKGFGPIECIENHAYKKFLRMNSVAHFVKCVPIQLLSSPRIPWFSKHGGFVSFALRTTFLFFGQWKQTSASDILAKMNRKTKLFIWYLFVPAHNSKQFGNLFKNHWNNFKQSSQWDRILYEFRFESLYTISLDIFIEFFVKIQTLDNSFRNV